MKDLINRYLRKRVLLFLTFTILLFFFVKNISANDSLGIVLDEILFFESGDEVPGKQNRTYSNYFKPEVKYINIEFNIKNLNYQIADKKYKISFIWKYFNGDEFGRSEATFNVKSVWTTAYINRGWGFADKGNWRLGRFTAQILVDGTLFAEKDFFINPYGKDFISFPKENKVIENLQNLPENINYQILQQYKIDPYFNSYYKIEFSDDGKNLAYRLSQFEQIKDYNSTSTIRNVYLFRNNKQIVPVYFRIDAFFDNNLKNLAYLGMKTTKATFHDVYAYFNGKQLFKSIYMPDFYISPDSKKYTYIWNSMPRLKSSFTWDSAYEYLMINQQKIQAEFLTKAKTINIKQPIFYIKNSDNSYNVIYTAKYKFDKQVHYALFNETERVSPQFDGYISKPYLSADEKKIAYIVEDKKEWFVMINDKRITKGYKEIKYEGAFKKVKDEIIFCESGNNIIYQAKIKGDWYVMKGDEIISDGFSNIESIVVNATGDKIAYKAKSGKKWSVYINKRKISQEFDFTGEEIVFSPDGNKLAYAAANDENMFVMVNDKKISSNFKIFHQNSMYIGKQPLAITKLTFNKTGDKVAYLVNYSSAKGDLITYNLQYYVMINNTQVSPKMYSASVISKKTGELFYAGIDISDLILHHVKIDF